MCMNFPFSTVGQKFLSTQVSRKHVNTFYPMKHTGWKKLQFCDEIIKLNSFFFFFFFFCQLENFWKAHNNFLNGLEKET